jgi:probable phosphoglycerate mutase
MRIVLIPCGHTEWADEGRLLGRVELPLTAAGQQQCAQWAEQLKALGIRKIVHAPDELATRTAEALARLLAVPTKATDDLLEVDLGLWTGLTEAQLKSRYASAHRELGEAPLNVNPPAGEALRVAADRLGECLRKMRRKNGNTTLGVVLRPLTFALAQCTLHGGEFAEMWPLALAADEPVIIECPENEDPAA